MRKSMKSWRKQFHLLGDYGKFTYIGTSEMTSNSNMIATLDFGNIYCKHFCNVKPGYLTKLNKQINKTPTTCEEGSTQHLLLHWRYLPINCSYIFDRPGLTFRADDN
jgi:hypothetical protein